MTIYTADNFSIRRKFCDHKVDVTIQSVQYLRSTITIHFDLEVKGEDTVQKWEVGIPKDEVIEIDGFIYIDVYIDGWGAYDSIRTVEFQMVNGNYYEGKPRKR